MAWRARKSLVKDLEPSSWAAPALGPKIERPASRKRSTTPATSGASGPTMVRSTPSSRAKASRPSRSSTPISTLASPGSRAVPALPGATKTCATRGDWATFQARACSRPPPPMISTFIRYTFILRIESSVSRGGIMSESPPLRPAPASSAGAVVRVVLTAVATVTGGLADGLLPELHVFLGQLAHQLHGRMAHGLLPLVLHALLLLHHQLGALLQVAGQGQRLGHVVDADELGQQVVGEHLGIAVGLLLLDDDREQDGAGQVLAALGILDPEGLVIEHQLSQILQGHIAALLGIIEPAVGILANHAHGAAPSSMRGASAPVRLLCTATPSMQGIPPTRGSMNLILLAPEDIENGHLARVTDPRRLRHLREVHRATPGEHLTLGVMGAASARGSCSPWARRRPPWRWTPWAGPRPPRFRSIWCWPCRGRACWPAAWNTSRHWGSSRSPCCIRAGWRRATGCRRSWPPRRSASTWCWGLSRHGTPTCPRSPWRRAFAPSWRIACPASSKAAAACWPTPAWPGPARAASTTPPCCWWARRVASSPGRWRSSSRRAARAST